MYPATKTCIACLQAMPCVKVDDQSARDLNKPGGKVYYEYECGYCGLVLRYRAGEWKLKMSIPEEGKVD